MQLALDRTTLAWGRTALTMVTVNGMNGRVEEETDRAYTSPVWYIPAT